MYSDMNLPAMELVVYCCPLPSTTLGNWERLDMRDTDLFKETWHSVIFVVTKERTSPKYSAESLVNKR